MDERRVPITSQWDVGHRPGAAVDDVPGAVGPGADRPGIRSPRSGRRLHLCYQCRGSVVGWNWKYFAHHLVCLGKLSESLRVLATAVVLALIIILPAASAVALYDPAAVGDRARIAASLREMATVAVAVIPFLEDLSLPARNPEPDGFRVAIDAGHGGQDAGSTGPSGLTEKELVLDIANRLRAHIESRLGAQVVLTRNDDVFVSLEARTEIANRADADLFISIHANASQRETSRGFETYFRNAPGAAIDQDGSREFATHVQNALATTIPSGRNRGVKSAPFAVLNGASMPSILAEVSFISNPEDERLLKEEEYRQQIAEALFDGVRSYSQSLDGYRTAGSTD